MIIYTLKVYTTHTHTHTPSFNMGVVIHLKPDSIKLNPPLSVVGITVVHHLSRLKIHILVRVRGNTYITRSPYKNG